MMLLKNVHDVDAFIAAVDHCRDDVLLRSVDGTEEFNLKSTLSRYIAIGRLCEEQGDSYEVFCMNVADENYMLRFFNEIQEKGI